MYILFTEITSDNEKKQNLQAQQQAAQAAQIQYQTQSNIAHMPTQIYSETDAHKMQQQHNIHQSQQTQQLPTQQPQMHYIHATPASNNPNLNLIAPDLITSSSMHLISSSINAIPSNTDHLNRVPYIDSNASTISSISTPLVGPAATTTTFSTAIQYPTASIQTLQQAHQTSQNYTHPTPQPVSISYAPPMPIIQNAIESPVIAKSIEDAIVTSVIGDNIQQQQPQQVTVSPIVAQAQPQPQPQQPQTQQPFIPLSSEYNQIQNHTIQSAPMTVPIAQNIQQSQMQRSITDESEMIPK